MSTTGSKPDKEAPVFYGGQAVIEGVMMRGPKHAAISVRRMDGSIETTVREATPWLVQHKALNKPFLRGAFALFDAMRLGVWSLRWSANQAMKDALAQESAVKAAGAAEGSGATNLASVTPTGKASPLPAAVAALVGVLLLIAGFRPETFGIGQTMTLGLRIAGLIALGVTLLLGRRLAQSDVSEAGEGTVKGTMAVGLLIGVGLFIALPTILTGALKPYMSAFWLNVVEGGIRLGLFFGYLKAITYLDGVRRIFQFHGAEHRVINAMEAGFPLTPEACRRFSVIHPRCGTSFMILVLLLATVVYTLFGWHAWWLRLVIRIGLLPIIAGVAYELLRLAGTFRSSVVLQAVSWPGRFSQKFTTREPDDSQTEVAISALEAVFAAERGQAPVEDAVPELA